MRDDWMRARDFSVFTRLARPRVAAQGLTRPSAPLAVAVLLAFATASDWRDPAMYYWGFVIIELCAAVLLLDIIITDGYIRHLLAMKWLMWVGSISYGLYLWHYPVYRTMAAMGLDQLNLIIWGTLVTFGFAILSYYLFGKTDIKTEKKLFR